MDGINNTNVISVKDLTKDYGNGLGVFNIDLVIKKGETHGYLGPNGAGKTTTIRHILGFQKAENVDTITIDGVPVWNNQNYVLANVGYLPGELAFPEKLSGAGFIAYISKLRKMQDLSHAAELATLFKLDIKKKIKQMALGEKRKLAIIVAFMHNPDILVLDEPTSGLDPVMQRVFIEYILHQKKLKKTILLSSHIYSEVEALCDNVSIIKSGRIIERLNLKDIKIKTKKKFKIEFSDNEQYQEFVLKNTIFEYFSKTPEKNQIRVFVDDMDINTFNKMLIDYSIKYIAEDIETLEDHFMRFYKKEDVKIDGKSI